MVIKEFDILPDAENWKDTGCELYESCLDCPRDRCIEDEPRGRQKMRMNSRSLKMLFLRRQGKSVKDIARAFAVSIRTVQRALAEHREEESVLNG
jgi:hypothetical protein